MSTHRYIDRICVAVLVLALLVTVAFMNGESLGITKVIDQDRENNSDSAWFTSNDLWGDWSTDGATLITLNGDSARVSGAGAYANGSEVVITQSGSYVVTGTLTNGRLTVDAKSSSKVWILLNGVNITSEDNAALRVDQADKVFLTLAAGTENSLTSGETMSEEALEDGTDGAIFAHDDLTINGSGALTVTAGYKHGIAANDDLVITGGALTVTAPKDAIHANDSLRVREAQITVTAGDDGLATSNDGACFYLESGSIDVTAQDDGIHIAGDITIEGGSLTIDAGDDGIHADGDILVQSGSILINKCYEGLEAKHIDMNGGEVTIYPSDDGFNANGGSGGFGGFGPRQQTTETTESSVTESNTAQTETTEEQDKAYIRITGGTVTIINGESQDADGLDSNGDLFIDGGDIRISLSGSGMNSALDYGSESGGVMEITGGTVIAAGASAMAESFDETSTQASILYNISSGVEAGSVISLEDQEGNVLLSWEVPNSATSIAMSCPEMAVGKTYLVSLGEQVEEIELAEISASFGDTKSGGFGGAMHFGGPMSRDQFNQNGGPGGGRRSPQSESGEEFDPSQMGEPPAMPSDGERPDFGNFDPSQMGEPPAMPSDGERPDFGNFDPSQMGEPPAMPSDGERPDFGNFDPSQMGERDEQTAQETEEAAGEVLVESGPQEVDRETWKTLALCAAVLLLGLVLGFAWKRHG